MLGDSSRTESAYIPFKQANGLDRISNPLIASFWLIVVGGSMPHKSLASSPALKGGASARQVLVKLKLDHLPEGSH